MAAPIPESNFSGTRMVIGLVIVVLVVWGLIALAFRSWKAHQVELATFGETQVAPAIDPMARVVPAGMAPETWNRAVDDTHKMLIALTGSGLLNRAMMEQLRADILARVERARPETSLEELTGLWNDLDAKAGPVIQPDTVAPPPNSRHAKRHPRPARPSILPPAPKRSLERLKTAG